MSFTIQRVAFNPTILLLTHEKVPDEFCIREQIGAVASLAVPEGVNYLIEDTRQIDFDYAALMRFMKDFEQGSSPDLMIIPVIVGNLKTIDTMRNVMVKKYGAQGRPIPIMRTLQSAFEFIDYHYRALQEQQQGR